MRPAKRRRRVFLLGSLLALVGAWLVVTQLWLPRWLPGRLEAALREDCACVFSVGGARVSLLLRWVELRNVHLESGHAADTLVVARVERLRLYPSLLRLARKEFFLERTQVHAPLVTLTEGDGQAPPAPPAEEKSGGWTFGGKELSIHDGSFQYERVSGKKKALLRTSQINGAVGAWHSLASTPPLVTKGEVDGLLEGSGKFQLVVAAPLFVPFEHVDVALKIEGLRLADMNPFFGPSEAIALKGVLHHGRTAVAVRERDLKAWVRTRYEGLGIEFGPNRERGVLDAALNNLGASIAVDASVSADSDDALRQTRGVSLKRKPRESIVGFIFRGMKEAALRVATGS